MFRKPKIVVIGGGTGLPVVLRGLRDKDVDITAVVTVADDGGSSGILRNYINVVPPGDIRNGLVALSELPQLELDVFQYRFNSRDQFFAGHAIGNLIISALAEMKGGIFTAVQELSDMMKIRGHIYPVANEPLTLNAEFTDGTTLSGESEITAAHKQIKRVWVTPSNDGDSHQVKPVPEVIQAIKEADQIVLGPGSLFTSILPNLMIDEVGRAVCESKAEVVYICNIMTQKGRPTTSPMPTTFGSSTSTSVGTLLIRFWSTSGRYRRTTLIFRNGTKFPSQLATTSKACVTRGAG